MYVILTSKVGHFHTEIIDRLQPVDAYDYLFYGQKKARFVIAKLLGETKIRVVEDESAIINDVPIKFLQKFETVDLAYNELRHLTNFGAIDTALHKVPIAEP